MNVYPFSNKQCNQKDHRFAQKYLLKSLTNNFSIHIVVHILSITLKKVRYHDAK